MKINIGPYKYWFSPHQIADKIFFWIDDRLIVTDDEFYNRWDVKARESFGMWLSKTWVYDFSVWIYKFQKRKVEIRIDPYDTWELYHTLALIIHPALIQLRDTNHGCGNIAPEDCPSMSEEDRWNWFMDEIIWAFGEIANNYKNEPDCHDMPYHDRIKNALTLFGKYYQSLWD
jgi:hypothetical protein